MIRLKRLLNISLLSLFLVSAVAAQDIEKTTKLRLQLIELQAQEEDARVRLQMLDEALKPENIERSLAGVGSTRPEDLREQRRRQLTIERNSAQAMLRVLETTRAGLEGQIVAAETANYQQSAYPSPSPTDQILAAHTKLSSPVMVAAAVMLLLVITTGVLALRTRKF